jgi:hypothetical protein
MDSCSTPDFQRLTAARASQSRILLVVETDKSIRGMSTAMTDSCPDHAARNAIPSMAIVPSVVWQKALVTEHMYKVHCLCVSHILWFRVTYIKWLGRSCRIWLVENAAHENGNLLLWRNSKSSIVRNKAAQAIPIPTRPGPMGQR